LIICFLGGIGSGKTLSIVREIITRKIYPFTNFNLNVSHHRLMFSDIVNIETDEKGRNRLTGVNWAYWEDVVKKHKHYSIFLDEMGGVISARTSMSKKNILITKWLSQIRKILQDSESNHIYFISQTARQVDVIFRELAQVIVHCRTRKVAGELYIIQDYYNGIENFYACVCAGRKYFKAAPYYKYYNRNEMVRFSDGEDYL